MSQASTIEINVKKYYEFTFGNYIEASEQELEEELAKVFHQVFTRHVTALKNKLPCVPLSGGYDSRLVVSMLKRCGVNNVVCFSYGRPNNPESLSSQAVAKALGYKWLFCPYDEESWYKWYHERQYSIYVEYASNLSSLAHPQDWPAVKEILPNLPKENLIFIPGHTGDFLSGGHIPEELFTLRRDLLSFEKHQEELTYEAVLSHHYSLWNWYNKDCSSLKESFIKRITDLIPPTTVREYGPISSYERWEFESRQARFIINSVRVYEFFGCKWMLPWWDYELTDFFTKIKPELRFQKKLYRNTLANKIFTDELAPLADIPVVGLLKNRFKKSLYKSIRKIIPNFIRAKYRRFIARDYHAFHGIYSGTETQRILRDVFPNIGSLDGVLTNVYKIVYPNINKKIKEFHINALGSLDYTYKIVHPPS